MPVNLEDKLAIQEAIAQYSYTFDGEDLEAFAALFTDDAVWEYFKPGQEAPAVRLESQTALKEWVAGRYAARRGKYMSRHFQMNTVCEALTSESARCRTMALITLQDTGAEQHACGRPGFMKTSGASRCLRDGDWLTADCLQTRTYHDMRQLPLLLE